MQTGLFSGSVRSGLRTRFNPRSRIGQGLISFAPWMSVLLILLGFSLLDPHFVLQPGITVELPGARPTGGTRPEMVAVILAVQRSGMPRQEIVFFDDERFVIRNKEHVKRLKNRLSRRAKALPGSTLIIQADAHVEHGTVIDVMRVAGEAGITHVTMATAAD